MPDPYQSAASCPLCLGTQRYREAPNTGGAGPPSRVAGAHESEARDA